jgi:DNA-binding protein HU-beta
LAVCGGAADDKNEIGVEGEMTKAELVTAIADRAGLNKAQAREALDAFIESVSHSLKAGQPVQLVGFGKFVPVKRAAGVARNPRTGEKVECAASSTCRFHAGDALKNVLNS